MARRHLASIAEDHELALQDGRTLTVSGQLVEIRSESGLLELRIQLTDQGPVLQMEAVKLALKASEDIAIEAKGEVRIVGKMIYLN